jgi:hypothetical protein
LLETRGNGVHQEDGGVDGLCLQTLAAVCAEVRWHVTVANETGDGEITGPRRGTEALFSRNQAEAHH